MRQLDLVSYTDPFDRLLLAHARVEGLVFATADSSLELYGIALLR